MDILTFAKTKQYKVIIICLLGFAVLCFILGGVFAGISVANPTPTQMTLRASSITRDYEGIYYLNLYKEETPIFIDTEPGNKTNTPVKVEILVGGSFASVNSGIKSGGIIVITLKKTSSGSFYFGKQLDIKISCGGITSNVQATITDLPEQIRFEYELYNRFTDDISNNIVISKSVYNSYVLSPYYIYAYLYIWDVRAQGYSYNVTYLDGDRTGISVNNKIITFDKIELLTPNRLHRFEVTFTYQGVTYTDILVVRITE